MIYSPATPPKKPFNNFMLVPMVLMKTFKINHSPFCWATLGTELQAEIKMVKRYILYATVKKNHLLYMEASVNIKVEILLTV